MDIFNKNIPANTMELYSSVCVQIIESNKLKSKALNIAISICDAHIDNEPELKKGTVFTIKRTMNDIKKELIKMAKDDSEFMGGCDASFPKQ